MIFTSKAQFQNQTFFAILMLLVFVGILAFGYNSITDISNTLNDEELAELRETILSQTSVCAQSSQKGRLETLKISPNQISHVCYISDLSQLSTQQYLKDQGIIQNHTVLLLNGPQDLDFVSASSNNIGDFVIYDIIPLEDSVELQSNNNCQIRNTSEPKFKFQFKC